MAIFLDENSKVIVQGMTGSEGMKHTQRMLASGTQIVGGVNPRKAGTSVDFDGGVSVPVYGTVAEAIEATGANVSVIFVPPAFAKSAVVEAIDAAYREYERGFEEVTRRARVRFEQRDWSGAQSDATERLALYKAHVDAAVADVHDILQDAVLERTVWAAMKSEHTLQTASLPDAELLETFFNSVTRRVFSTVGVDPAIEYLDRTAAVQPDEQDAGIRHDPPRITAHTAELL